MQFLRPTAAAALAAAVALPLLAGASPAAPLTRPVPAPAGGDDTSVTRTEFAAMLRAARVAGGADGNPLTDDGPAPAEAAVTIPFASTLYISYGTRAVRLTIDQNATVTGSTAITDRTDISVGPAGDSMAYRPSGGGATRVSSLGPAHTTIHDPSEAPATWAPTGDGFTQRIGGGLFAQLTNPDFGLPFDTADATSPAVSPYGGDAYALRSTATGQTVQIIPAPFIGESGSATVTDLQLQTYQPGRPAVAQEPGAGVTIGVNDGRTYLAFQGVVPGSSPAQARLFVDHQNGAATDRAGYTNPVPVADTGAVCDVAAPAFSPNARMLTYVRAVGPAGSECTQVQVRVKLAGADGVYQLADTDKLLWAGAANGPLPTVVSWRPSNPAAETTRIGGANRYEVAASTAVEFYDKATTNAVVLAGGTAYADALAGGPLAVANNGPSLLTPSSGLNSATEYALKTVLATGRTVYILGGTASVSTAVENRVKSLGYTPVRLGGASRFDVAVNVAKELDRLRGGAKPTAAFVSSGSAFADALVAGPPASLYDAPVLLSNGPTLPAVTKSYLDGLPAQAEIFAIGGSGAASVITDPRTEVVSGASRYEVAGNVAQRFFTGWYVLAVADGRNWPDAVSGGTLMGWLGQPILLTSGTSTLPAPTQQQALQTRESLDYVMAFGGTASVPAGALTNASSAAGAQTTYYGPAFYFSP